MKYINPSKKRLLVNAKIFLLMVTIFVFRVSTASAVTYYVSTSGNDSNSGTEVQPLRTIQKATDMVVPGDTIIVLAGNYSERTTISSSGFSGSAISFQAKGAVATKGFVLRGNYIDINGFEIKDTPATNGSNYLDGAGVAVLGSSSHCMIQNNNIHNVTSVGIYLSSSSSDCEIENNKVSYAGLCGMHIDGFNHNIIDNDISHSLQHPPNWTNLPSGMDADGIRFFGSGHNINSNYIHDILLSEDNATAHIDCFQTWGPANGITLGYNRCINKNNGMQGATVEQINQPVRDLTFNNNFFSTEGTSIDINNQEVQPDMPRMKIVNNTFYDSGYYAILFRGSSSSIVKNNLFINGSTDYLFVANSPGLDVGYNCTYHTNGSTPNGTRYPNDLWGVDPKCVSIVSGNFELLPSSPLIDAGIYVGLPYLNLAPDIGAYEYQAVDITSPLAPEGLNVR
jgi:parallel beta-helix repeat protein